MAGFVREFILGKLSESMDSAGDFHVFTYDPLARYPAEWVAVDSIVSCQPDQ